MPHAQACAAYILRVGVIRQLPEAGQRKLLERLAAAAAGGIAPPLVVAALEGVAAVLEVLGEVDADEARPIEQVQAGSGGGGLGGKGRWGRAIRSPTTAVHRHGHGTRPPRHPPIPTPTPGPQVLSSKATAPCSAVRHAAASALAALALARPPVAAKLLGSYLEAVEAGAQTLQMLAAPYSRPGVTGSVALLPGVWAGPVERGCGLPELLAAGRVGARG